MRALPRLLILLCGCPALFAISSETQIAVFDSHGKPIPNRSVTYQPGDPTDAITRALSAQAQGKLASGFQRSGQDAVVVTYAWSFLNGGTAQGLLPKLASVPEPLKELPGGRPDAPSLTGFVSTALDVHEWYEFATGVVATGGINLFALQVPLEAVLDIAMEKHFRDDVGMPLTIKQADYSPAADLILQFYLDTLLKGTDASFPEALPIVRNKQTERMGDSLIRLSRQAEGLRLGVGSAPMRVELLRAIVSSAPPAQFGETLSRVEEWIERSEGLEKGVERELDTLRRDLRQTLREREKAPFPKSRLGTKVLFATIKIMQREVAVPVGLLHLVRGSSDKIASMDVLPAAKVSAGVTRQVADLPAQAVNQVLLAAQTTVSKFETRLHEDMLRRYPGPELGEVLGQVAGQIIDRYKQDLAKREMQWAEAREAKRRAAEKKKSP